MDVGFSFVWLSWSCASLWCCHFLRVFVLCILCCVVVWYNSFVVVVVYFVIACCVLVPFCSFFFVVMLCVIFFLDLIRCGLSYDRLLRLIFIGFFLCLFN